MKAAVFCRNIGMSGTCSIVMTAVAMSAASWCLSANIPTVAYTSVMGIVMLLRQIVIVARGGSGTCGCGHASHLMQEPEHLGVEPPGDLGRGRIVDIERKSAGDAVVGDPGSSGRLLERTKTMLGLVCDMEPLPLDVPARTSPDPPSSISGDCSPRRSPRHRANELF